MDPEDTELLDRLATLVSGFANFTRLTLLFGFHHGYTAGEVTDVLDISRAGVQKNIERMVDADLVYRPAADEAPTYALTPLGEFFAGLFEAYGPTLVTAVTILHQSEATVQQQLEDSPVADGLSQAEKERLVHTKKWQEANDQISKLLGQDAQDCGSVEADSTQSRAFAFESSLSEDEIADILDEATEENDE